MPRRDDISSICILGSGPIVIGQACEFDYSGTQAIRALKAHGYRVILVNSNPATIMTDPEIADATYIEPLTAEYVRRVLEKERPDAVLPTMGGQTALNLAMQLDEQGVFEELGIELLGTSREIIERAEDRQTFRAMIEDLGMDQAASGVASTIEEAWEILEETGFPAILRPSFTMGGTGGNIAYNRAEFEEYVKWSLQQSPTSQVLIDQSLLGWKEYELEVMRDRADNVVIICGIENIDPMGVHTGDSITVAPIQTLTDREYQSMRDDAIRIIRTVGVESGGCNIQFAVDPDSGRRVVIEMNPRVSRSSALASKATGYPIAKIAALLAVGFTLDEITNDITGKTKAAFEPVLDYVVTKIPRFNFDKFPGASDRLTTQMKSVGEVMSIARTFPESLLKAVRSLEQGDVGFSPKLIVPDELAARAESARDELLEFFRPHLMKPTPHRLWYVMDAMRAGITIEEIHQLSDYDPWFLGQMQRFVPVERALIEHASSGKPLDALPEGLLLAAKRLGFGDEDIASRLGCTAAEVAEARKKQDIKPVYKQVDTCAAEFESVTSYFYSSYENGENEAERSDQKTVMILGGGPNRIGQGIEFDYCAVHASIALREQGWRTIMVNCNPETVSTDYDISDRLYFEPLTYETVMAIIEHEKPDGVILQFGGQTPLKLARALYEAGVPVLGTAADAIDRTEDRKLFNQIVNKLALLQPEAGTATEITEAREIVARLGYPVLVRPSYVLGGQAMVIVNTDAELEEAFERARVASANAPVLLDKFLGDAIEVDVDCISDGEQAVIGGIMEHIEEAGVHSGDSACVTPPYHLAESVLRIIREQTLALARELEIVGLMNVQFAVRDHQVYILEVNPRASRTIPFVSKSIGAPLAQYAARAMAGEKLSEIGFSAERIPRYYSVKESVFPFTKFPEIDCILGPQMQSTGEVMGIDPSFELAYLKAQISAGNEPPEHQGKVFLSVRDGDKWSAIPVAKRLVDLGFEVVATRGTAKLLGVHGIPVSVINKVKEGQPHIVDAIINNEITMVINTTTGSQSIQDSRSIRRATINRDVPYFTTLPAARAAANAMAASKESESLVRSVQSYHGE
ncbi:MAG: carbamoyl-phosphate synthase large subunit [Myxococcota bacterium]|nr:carbamoyl-phosphate synthase large subunit [Myxococcota bacterium]